MPPDQAPDFAALGAQLRDLLERKREALYPGLKRAFQRDAHRWDAAIKARRGRLGTINDRKGPDEHLARRTGNLMRSLFTKVEGETLDTLTSRKGVAGPSARYAITHELGTVGAGGTLPDIVPVHKQWLAIPIGASLTPSGVPKIPGPRARNDLRFVLSRRLADTAFLVEKGKPLSEALYILKKRVAIPPRLGMRATHAAQAADRLRDIHAAVLEALAA